MRTARRLTAALAVCGAVLAACGGSDEDSSDDTVTTEAPAEEPAATEAPEEEPAATEPAEEGPAPTEPSAEEPAEEEPVETEPAEEDAAGGEAIVATLSEWAIDAPTEYAAGEITFTATNGGSFPHEFVVIRGDGYASLPLADGGAVIEDELPDGALIGRTARMGGGSSEDLVVNLEPGNYVLVCNLGSGSNSHAGMGQNLDIVVS